MPAVLDPQSAEYLSLVKNLSPHEQALVVDMLKQLHSLSDTQVSSEEDVFVEALAGCTFSHEERVKLELDTLFQYFQWRRQLLKDALTSSHVAQLLGTSRQTPHDRVKARTLLGISDNGVLRFPSWQFDPEGPDGVIEGLPDVLKVLQVSDLAKLSWLVRSNPLLEGLTPSQALKQRQKERVVQEAMGVGVS